ncbi:Uncharacterised protein [Collinsella intestinalis]|nr:Uncharacterised protein [Collinsella intestinalis]
MRDSSATFQFGKCRMALIFIGNNQLRNIKHVIAVKRRPYYSNFGIIPHKSTLVSGMIDIVAFVA